jgi:putative transposase
MLRERVPQKRIFLRPKERQQLIKLAKSLGPSVRHSLTVVSYSTYRRWIRDEAAGKQPAKMGRPRISERLNDAIVRIARETGWGYTRILGELKKLGVKVSRTTVQNVLRRNGFDPGPKRGKGTWDDFLRIHAETLWQCDFLSKRIWTPTGWRQYFVLAFLHLGTRQVFATEACQKPDCGWMKRQADAFLNHIGNLGQTCEWLLHDHDGMFVESFDDIFREYGAKIKKVGPKAANMNAFIERWIQSVKHECLDHFLVFGKGHFDYLMREYVAYYHTETPHQSLGNRPLTDDQPVTTIKFDRDGPIACRQRLGGLLKHYYRKAA